MKLALDSHEKLPRVIKSKVGTIELLNPSLKDQGGLVLNMQQSIPPNCVLCDLEGVKGEESVLGVSRSSLVCL